MASTDVSINQLPETNQVVNGDFIILQTPNATNRLNFSNFVVGLENTTFGNTIELHTTEIQALSAEIENIPGEQNLAPLSAAINTNTTNIEALSTETTMSVLSVVSLSADELYVSGDVFRGYPAYAQTIYNTVTTRAGSTGATTDIDLESNITLKSLNSRLKISFTVPGSLNLNDHTAALVLQYSQDGVGWSDIPDFLGVVSNSALRGTVILGGDSANEEGHTSTFTGVYEPTVLGTNNILYIRVAIRLETGVDFLQNRSQQDNASDATGVSVLLLEELFTS